MERLILHTVRIKVEFPFYLVGAGQGRGSGIKYCLNLESEVLRALVQQHFSLFVPVLSKYLSFLLSLYQEHSTILTIQGAGPLREFSDPSTGELIWFLISQSWNKNQTKKRGQVFLKKTTNYANFSTFVTVFCCLHPSCIRPSVWTESWHC